MLTLIIKNIDGGGRLKQY
uniref:Uncharacterized protein n=1 Tax=Rhizophora mucronata TaxID=61149 RepID=A0A2P2NSJ6_RHIMU